MALPTYPRGFLYSEHDIVLPKVANHLRPQSTSRGKFWFGPESIAEIYDVDGIVVVLSGHAQYVDPNKSEGNLQVIVQQIAALWGSKGRDAVESFLYDLGGRYVLFLLGADEKLVYQDAHGMRSVYYTSDASAVSSHEHLLAQVTHAKNSQSRLAALPLSIRWSQSKYLEMHALLPNHRLNLADGTVQRFYPHRENPYLGVSTRERLDLIERLWTEQIRMLAEEHELAISLTGGLDSRTSFAVARPHWAKIHTFTYTTIPRGDSSWSRSIYKDEVIVGQILDVVDVRHTFLRRNEAPSLSAAEQKILSQNSSGEHGRWLVKLYQQHIAVDGLIHLRANLHETGRNYFHKFRTPSNQMSGLRKLMKNQVQLRKPLLEPELEQVMEEFEAEYIAAQFDLLPHSYELLDMFYWEVRQGRWFSEIFNETDAAFDTAIPFNHRRIIDLALSFSATERKNGFVFHELINRNAPVLNFFGVNDTENLYEKQKARSVVSSGAITSDFKDQRVMVVYSINKNPLAELPFQGSIYLPAAHAKTGQFSEVVWKVSELTPAVVADIRLQIHNKYQNAKATDYLKLSVEVDGTTVLSHDLSCWPSPFGVTITKLASDSFVSVKVQSLRNITRDSWEVASRTEVLIEATPSLNLDRNIWTDNPLASISI